MCTRTLIAVVGAAAILAACTDSTGPPLNEPPPQDVAVPDGALHSLRWDLPESPVQFAVRPGLWDEGGEIVVDPGVLVSPSAGGPALDTYQVSFWAMRGKRRSIQINYVSGDEDEVQPFLRLVVRKKSLRHYPDGSRTAKGDSVLITVSIDPSNVRVYFEPTGLTFSKRHPAVLQIWYGGAGGDLNGDGVVDEEDRYIEQQLLGLWYQQESGDPWYAVPAWHNTGQKWFRAWLLHFSGYQISY